MEDSPPEEKPSFSLLYSSKKDVWANVACIAVYVDRFAKRMGIETLQTDPQALTSVGAALVSPDFPHKDGIEKASPFKKAANFFVWFVAQRPIIDEIPADLIGEDLAGISNHQNAIFAYHLAVDCLHGATLYRGEENVAFTLSNRIKVSYHFFRDFVEAYSSTVPHQDFRKVSLLFESLAYKANDASYPEVI